MNLKTKKKRIGALIIGQTPRPDLLEPLAARLPHVDIITVGALDGLSVNNLPDASPAPYPLSTMMEGTLVQVAEDFLVPRLQTALDELETQDICATILLCAGTFAQLMGNLPLIKPFNVGVAAIQALNMTSLGFIAPFPQQETPIRLRWEALGLQTTVWTADLERQDSRFQKQLLRHIQENDLQAIVLDYVGHTQESVQELQYHSPIPIIDLGDLAIRVLASII